MRGSFPKRPSTCRSPSRPSPSASPRWRRISGSGCSPARHAAPSSPWTGRRSCRTLAGHRIWIPGIAAGTEWAAYYEELAAAFGLTIDAVGPNFGTESLLDVLADVAELASLVGEQARLLWPADYGLRRIAVRDPTPVYPHSLIWRSDNPHPALTALRRYLGSVRPGRRDAGTWTPSWARPG